MKPEEVTRLLNREVAASLGLPQEKLQASDRLVSDLGAESLDLVDLTFRLEKTFQITIPQGELFEAGPARLRELSLQKIQDYILGRLASIS
jgi:acyl carrier protein